MKIIPVQNWDPARQTGSQARPKFFFTPTSRAPLDGTQAVCPGEYGDKEEQNSVEEEESDGAEGVPAPVGESQCTRGPTVSQSNQPVSHKYEPSLLAIMQHMTQIMANLQADSCFEASRPAAFKDPSIKAPEYFGVTQPFKFGSFIQSCQLIFHNYQAKFSEDRKKVLYSTSFLIDRTAKFI
ncbi:hypothetical protein O181_059016 [Austropuccinia psidii MF-1]|uniref:DUF4939 domain-containing protein n=1 Tax=Austropuccinia psidii MF-1 TaxID=1389203 RepID=A0A9Q3EBF3_9BASI|nr:hypothetical protein [Austropuccinia psidii MF-1]